MSWNWPSHRKSLDDIHENNHKIHPNDCDDLRLLVSEGLSKINICHDGISRSHDATVVDIAYGKNAICIEYGLQGLLKRYSDDDRLYSLFNELRSVEIELHLCQREQAIYAWQIKIMQTASRRVSIKTTYDPLYIDY
jgi:hypothetical protein